MMQRGLARMQTGSAFDREAARLQWASERGCPRGGCHQSQAGALGEKGSLE